MKKKRLLLLWKIAVILLVNILVVLAVAQPALPALSRRGSRGEEVKQIQTVLKDRELYEGNIDGIYGSQTEKAVIQFQKQMGLTPDGIVGPKTLSAMGLGDVPSGVTGIGGYSANEVALLARIISAESRENPMPVRLRWARSFSIEWHTPAFPILWQVSSISPALSPVWMMAG